MTFKNNLCPISHFFHYLYDYLKIKINTSCNSSCWNFNHKSRFKNSGSADAMNIEYCIKGGDKGKQVNIWYNDPACYRINIKPKPALSFSLQIYILRKSSAYQTQIGKKIYKATQYMHLSFMLHNNYSFWIGTKLRIQKKELSTGCKKNQKDTYKTNEHVYQTISAGNIWDHPTIVSLHGSKNSGYSSLDFRVLPSV